MNSRVRRRKPLPHGFHTSPYSQTHRHVISETDWRQHCHLVCGECGQSISNVYDEYRVLVALGIFLITWKRTKASHITPEGCGRFYAWHFFVSQLCDGGAYLLSVAALPSSNQKEDSHSFTSTTHVAGWIDPDIACKSILLPVPKVAIHNKCC